MTDQSGIAGAQLKSIFERWERLEEEKRAISDDLKDLFAEAKANGYNGKALRVAFRHVQKMSVASERSKLESLESDVDLYVAALTGTDLADSETTRGTREARAA